MKRSLLVLLAISGFMLGGCALDSIQNVQWNPTNHLNSANPPKGIMGAAPAAPAQPPLATLSPATAGAV